jgi:hypothetical protein
MEGERVARGVLTTISEELGPRVFFGGVELAVPARILRCWGKAERPARQDDRAVRGDPRGLLAHCRERGGLECTQLRPRILAEVDVAVSYCPWLYRLVSWWFRWYPSFLIVLFLAGGRPKAWLASCEASSLACIAHPNPRASKLNLLKKDRPPIPRGIQQRQTAASRAINSS